MTGSPGATGRESDLACTVRSTVLLENGLWILPRLVQPSLQGET